MKIVRRQLLLFFLMIFSSLFSNEMERSPLLVSRVTPELKVEAVSLSSQGMTPLFQMNTSPFAPLIKAAVSESGNAILGGYSPSFGVYILEGGYPLQIHGDAAPSNHPNGEIHSLSINRFGEAVIGGIQNENLYAARITPQGLSRTLPISSSEGGLIEALSINHEGKVLMGGFLGSYPNGTLFVGISQPDGSVTPVTCSGLPSNAKGMIWSVSLNSEGEGLMVGTADQKMVGMRMSSNGEATLLPLPASQGTLNSVSLNDGGDGLLGGMQIRESQKTYPYAALVDPKGTLTPLDLFSQEGVISSVALNPFGEGIIGGTKELKGCPYQYAARVNQKGELKEVLIEVKGEICSVSMSASGVGLIGGKRQESDHQLLYGALVAPNGSVTPLPSSLFPDQQGTILSVSLAPSGLTAVDPKSFGLGAAIADPILTLSSLVFQNRLAHPIFAPDAMEKVSKSATSSPNERAYYPRSATWVSPFGLYAHSTQQGSFPHYKEKIRGTAFGLDLRKTPSCTLGIGCAYALQEIHWQERKGRIKCDQALAALYGEWSFPYLKIRGALYASFTSLKSLRKSLEFLTSRSSVKGYLLSPHVELQLPLRFEALTLAPFSSIDWIHSWQGKVAETGDSGLNLRIKPAHFSLLNLKTGLRLTQKKECRSGTLICKESAYWIKKIPLDQTSISASYEASSSFFDLQLLDKKIPPLGALQCELSFSPYHLFFSELSLNYLGEWGKAYASHGVTLEIKRRF